MEIENNGTIMELYGGRLTLFSTLARAVSLCHREQLARVVEKRQQSLSKGISRDARIRIGFMRKSKGGKRSELLSRVTSQKKITLESSAKYKFVRKNVSYMGANLRASAKKMKKLMTKNFEFTSVLMIAFRESASLFFFSPFLAQFLPFFFHIQ